MAEQARADEFERLRKRLTSLNGVILASIVVALGMTIFFFFGPKNEAVKAAPGRLAGDRASGEVTVAKQKPPAPVVSSLPAPMLSAARPLPSAAVPDSATASALPPHPASAAAAVVQPVPPARTDVAAKAAAASVPKGDQAAEPLAGHAAEVADHAEKARGSDARACETSGWYVQLGALRGDGHVRALVARSSGHGVDICTAKDAEQALTLVLAGPYRDASAALQGRNHLRQALGLTGFLRKYAGRD